MFQVRGEFFAEFDPEGFEKAREEADRDGKIRPGINDRPKNNGGASKSKSDVPKIQKDAPAQKFSRAKVDALLKNMPVIQDTSFE